MVQDSNDLAAKPVDLASILGIHKVEGEKQLLQGGLLPPHVYFIKQLQQNYHGPQNFISVNF